MTSSQDTLFYAAANKDDRELKFESSSEGLQSLVLPEDTSCLKPFVVGDDNEIIAEMNNSSCKGGIKPERFLTGHIHLASGHLESIFLHEGSVVLK